MRSHDLGSVHEAMEQQTVSIAKAGMLSSLNTRCTIVAAINPTGGLFVEGEDVKTKLEKPLLSRFDLILFLKDTKNHDWNKMISDHIVYEAIQEMTEEKLNTSNSSKIEWELENLWKEDTIREYLAYVGTLKPCMDPQAECILRAVYLKHRNDPRISSERKTVRLLDSLIRLAEGHARLMNRETVHVMDAVVAAQLVQGVTESEEITGCPFPEDSMAYYGKEGKKTLENLGLSHLKPALNYRNEDES